MEKKQDKWFQFSTEYTSLPFELTKQEEFSINQNSIPYNIGSIENGYSPQKNCIFVGMNMEIERVNIGETVIYLLPFSDFDPNLHLDHLSATELERFFQFKHLKRKQEFVATRLLKHAIFGFSHIHYNSVGAPYIHEAGFISISHGSNLVGISVNESHATGLDLELIRDKAQRIHSKFLNSSEKLHFDSESNWEMTACWSAKEVLYKLAGRKEIDFKKELLLSKHDSFHWTGEIVNPTQRLSTELTIFEKHNHIITLNSSPVVSI